MAELEARSAEWAAAGLQSVRAVGDAYCPGTIAAAVWDGRRYAEELDGAARRRRGVPPRARRGCHLLNRAAAAVRLAAWPPRAPFPS